MFNDLVTIDRRKLKATWKVSLEEELDTIKKIKETVVDMNGVEIEPGHIVVVQQDDGKSEAIVVDVFPDRPTKLEPGHWVDIDGGGGVEGMMSYILEVVGIRLCKP